MKVVLMSLKPQWWDKMISGEKTKEVRKTAPMAFRESVSPFHVFVYISGTNEVRGHFLCPGFERTVDMRQLSGPSCVPAADLHLYAGPKDEVVAWSVASPHLLPSPLPLSAFGLKRPPMSWQYVDVPPELIDQVFGDMRNFFAGAEQLTMNKCLATVEDAKDMTKMFSGTTSLRYKRRYKDCQRPDGNCNVCPLYRCHMDCHYQPITQLELARRNKGMSITQLSALTMVNERQIQKVESGESLAGNMTAINLLSIAKALDVAPETLI